MPMPVMQRLWHRAAFLSDMLGTSASYGEMAMADFDDAELAVLRAVKIMGGVTGRDWFRSDRPYLREAFDRLVAKKYLQAEYFVASDIEDQVR
jgi:hypothetical protein